MFDYSFDQPLLLNTGNKPKISKALYKKDIAIKNILKHSRNPRYSVVIVAYNENEAIFDLLTGLKSQSQNKIEIIVVDNGLNAATKSKLLTDKSVSYIEASSNVGPSHGRNIGAAYANGEYLIFIDADGQTESNFITKVHEFISKYPETITLRGKVLSKSNHASIHTAPKHYDLGNNVINHYPSTEGNSVWKKSAFDEAGGFEESLYGGEGIVLAYRLYGFYNYPTENFYYSPDLILYHDYNTDQEQLIRKVKRTEIARKHIDIKYPLLKEFLAKFPTYDQITLTPSGKNTRNAVLVTQAKETIYKQFEEYTNRLLRNRWSDGSLRKISNPVFSVIIPHYNLGEMVHDAVQSVMRQTFQSFEIIVVDDLSPDRSSLAFLKPLEDKVRVIYHKKNTGVAGARNTGVEASKGKYILCLDADDTIEPEYLEQAFNVFESFDEVGIVSTWVNLHGGRTGHWKPRQDIGVPEALVDSPIPTASCFRKKAWQEAGGYNVEMRGYEDWHMWVSILSKNWKTKVIPYLNFNYFIRPGSKVNTSNRNAVELVSRIVHNNRELYENNMEQVIAIKHKQIVDLRHKVRKLEKQNIALSNKKSLAGKGIKAVRLSAKGSRQVVDEVIATKSIRSGVELLFRKVHTAQSIARNRYLTKK